MLLTSASQIAETETYVAALAGSVQSSTPLELEVGSPIDVSQNESKPYPFYYIVAQRSAAWPQGRCKIFTRYQSINEAKDHGMFGPGVVSHPFPMG